VVVEMVHTVESISFEYEELIAKSLISVKHGLQNFEREDLDIGSFLIFAYVLKSSDRPCCKLQQSMTQMQPF